MKNIMARFATHILLVLIVNFAWAVAFENIFDTLWYSGNEVYWDRLYVFGLIATLLDKNFVPHNGTIIRKLGKRVPLCGRHFL